MPILTGNDVDELDPRVQAYLKRQMDEVEKTQTPEYRAQRQQMLDSAADAKNTADFGAVLANSTGMIGNVGGKVSGDGAANARMAQSVGDTIDQRVKGYLANEPKFDDRILSYLSQKDAHTQSALAKTDALNQQDRIARENRDAQAQRQRDHDATMKEIAGMNAGNRQELRDEKRADKEASLQIPGYQRTGEVFQTSDEAKKGRDAVGTLSNFNNTLDTYMNLVREHGPAEFVGEASGQMESLKTTIAMELKNLYELGALNASDYATLSSQLPDPSSMSSVMTKSGTALAGLKTLRNNLNRKVESKLTAQGYQSKNPYQPIPETGYEDGVAIAGDGKIRVTNGKETLEIDADDLEDAKRDGFRRVD